MQEKASGSIAVVSNKSPLNHETSEKRWEFDVDLYQIFFAFKRVYVNVNVKRVYVG